MLTEPIGEVDRCGLKYDRSSVVMLKMNVGLVEVELISQRDNDTTCARPLNKLHRHDAEGNPHQSLPLWCTQRGGSSFDIWELSWTPRMSIVEISWG